jgi:hypothetical protein
VTSTRRKVHALLTHAQHYSAIKQKAPQLHHHLSKAGKLLQLNQQQ